MNSIPDVIARTFAGTKEACLSADDMTAILTRQNGRCAGCSLPLAKAVIYGHILPRRNGGGHGIENREALHPECEAERNRSGRG